MSDTLETLVLLGQVQKLMLLRDEWEVLILIHHTGVCKAQVSVQQGTINIYSEKAKGLLLSNLLQDIGKIRFVLHLYDIADTGHKGNLTQAS